MTMIDTDTPRIYVADLADYNAGILRGKWIDATDEDLAEQVEAFLAERGHEEYAIHDFEGFYGLRIEECEPLAEVQELARLLEEHGPAYAAYAEHVGHGYATAEDFEEAYCGEWVSIEEYAEELAEETRPFLSDSPEARVLNSWPYNYIDWERAARDLILGGDYWTADSPNYRVFVFRSI